MQQSFLCLHDWTYNHDVKCLIPKYALQTFLWRYHFTLFDCQCPHVAFLIFALLFQPYSPFNSHSPLFFSLPLMSFFFLSHPFTLCSYLLSHFSLLCKIHPSVLTHLSFSFTLSYSLCSLICFSFSVCFFLFFFL